MPFNLPVQGEVRPCGQNLVDVAEARARQVCLGLDRCRITGAKGLVRFQDGPIEDVGEVRARPVNHVVHIERVVLLRGSAGEGGLEGFPEIQDAGAGFGRMAATPVVDDGPPFDRPVTAAKLLIDGHLTPGAPLAEVMDGAGERFDRLPHLPEICGAEAPPHVFVEIRFEGHPVRVPRQVRRQVEEKHVVPAGFRYVIDALAFVGLRVG